MSEDKFDEEPIEEEAFIEEEPIAEAPVEEEAFTEEEPMPEAGSAEEMAPGVPPPPPPEAESDAESDAEPEDAWDDASDEEEAYDEEDIDDDPAYGGEPDDAYEEDESSGYDGGYDEERMPASAGGGFGPVSETFTEVTERSWGERLGGAVTGVIFGLILFLAAFPLLFWNEGRAVRRHKSLTEGAGAVISVPADRVDPANAGKLVHVVGLAATDAVLTDGGAAAPVEVLSVPADRVDPANNGKLIHISGLATTDTLIPDRDFGVSVNAIKLERRVHMYQWMESKEAAGQESAAAYQRVWSDRPIDSNRFRDEAGHRNPNAMPFRSLRLAARQVTVGGFLMPPEQVRELDNFEPLSLEPGMADIPANLRDQVKYLPRKGLYIGADPAAPQIGDVRITYHVVKPAEVTLMGRQNGAAIEPYPTPDGNAILGFALGRRSTDEMLPRGVSANAIKLKRGVQMYQWTERSTSKNEKKLGGKEVTTTEYTYSPDWSERLIDSRSFKVPEGHSNPQRMPVESRVETADRVTLGAFRLPPRLIDRLGNYEPLPVNTISAAIPAAIRTRTRLDDGGYYIGADPMNPRIGDLRVRYSVVRPGEVTVVAMQQGDTFAPYQTRTGAIEEFNTGIRTPDDIFKSAGQQNTMMTWGLRVGGFLLMLIGIGMMLKPLSVVLDVVPFLGNLAESGIGIISFLIAAAFSMLVIALAWILYRPLLGGVLLAAAAILVVAIRMIPRGKAA